MTSNTRWISFHDVKKHPEDSILLAYLRGQKLEARSSVVQHIEHEQCSVCLQKLNELKQVSATLDVLGEIRSYQSYPELTVAGTYTRMQNAINGANYPRRPRKSAVRLISIPAAIGLALLFTMAMLVFAHFTIGSLSPFSNTGVTRPGLNTSTMVVTPHTISTPGANATATATDIADAKEPHMRLCSTQTNITPMRLVICGVNFDSEHKVTLIFNVPGKESISMHAIPVDKHGKFQVTRSIATCSNVPTLIVGFENTDSKPIKVKLQITSFGSCSIPRTTPAVRSSGFSSNYVP